MLFTKHRACQAPTWRRGRFYLIEFARIKGRRQQWAEGAVSVRARTPDRGADVRG